MAGANTFIERAARMGADLVSFPEIYPQLAVSDAYHNPEPAESGSLDRAREAARKHKVYLVWPRLEYAPERGVRNTAILIDRDGEVVGRYDRMFPTIGEIEGGIVPGTEAPSFDTDFGRVGMLICFDMNFREVVDSLAQGKPDVVAFPSMYRGGLQAQALAYELGAYVMTSISAELGQVINRCGRVLKESTYESLVVVPINTNSIAMHMNENWNKMDAMLARYGPTLSFDYHTREAFYVVESTEQPIEKLIEEFKLEPAPDYYARCRKTRTEALAKFARAHPEASQSARR